MIETLADFILFLVGLGLLAAELIDRVFGVGERRAIDQVVREIVEQET